MTIEQSRRLAAVEPYIFAEIAAGKQAAAESGLEVIDLGRGGPDLPPYGEALEELAVEAADPARYSYTPYSGSPRLQRAAGDWYERHFGVRPAAGCVPLMGSKGALSRIFLAFADPGDTVILPDPAFPSYRSAAVLAGLEIHTLALEAERGWLPDLAAIPDEVARRARLILLNYPNNPTGGACGRDFLAELVAWARETDTLAVYDNAYQFLGFDEPALSILEVPGAEEIALEFHTLSKAYAMAGARAAFAAGAPEAVAALRKIELYHQAGLFAPLIQAVCVALEDGDDYVAANRRVFRERRDAVSAALTAMGWEHNLPAGAAYFFLRLDGPPTTDDAAYCRELLASKGVALVPGRAFGEEGRGWVRLALTRPRDELERALELIADFRAVR